MTRPTDADLEAASRRLGDRLRELGWRVASAESSTAGLIGHAITMIPGSSDYYVGGAISYTNLAKQKELGVDPALIASHGAVSREVAGAMAEGAWRRFGVELGVAVTGIAGPLGGTPDKPVGLHFVAAARPGHPPSVDRLDLTFDRDGNRAAAALAALELAIREASV